MYLLLDIKTKGSPKNVYKPIIDSDLFDISITEIAWLLVNDKKKIVEKQHFKSVQEGFVNYQDYEKYSNSPDFYTIEHYGFDHIIDNWLKDSLEKTKLVIYYDISLKDNLIDMLHIFEVSKFENPLLTKDRLSILDETQDLFKQENKNTTHSLASLYFQLFKENLPEDIKLDAYLNALSECFFKLKEDKYLKFSESRNYHTESKTPDEILPSTIKSIKGTIYKMNSHEKNQGKQSIRNSYLIANHLKNGYEIVEIKNINANGISTSCEEYIFKSNALRYAKLFSSKKGLLTAKEYKYNDVGNLSSINYFNGQWDFLGSKQYSYDENGNLLSIFFKKSDFTLVLTKHRYNGLGELYIESSHISDENLDKEYSKIDCKGNIIETFRYSYIDSSTGIALSSKNKYNRHNLLVEKNTIKIVDNASNLQREKNFKYDYRYDEKGNWIRKIERRDGVPCYVEVREIEYINI